MNHRRPNIYLPWLIRSKAIGHQKSLTTCWVIANVLLYPHTWLTHTAIDDEPTKSAAPEPAPVPALCDAASQATMDELIAEQMPLVWSAPFNLCWSRAWVKEFQCASFSFRVGDDGPLYLFCSKHYNVGSCYKLQPHGDAFTLARPLSPIQSLDVIISQYGNCTIHNLEVQLVLTPLTWTIDDNDIAVATPSA